MIAVVPNVIGWIVISFAKVRFNCHLFSFHALAFCFALYSWGDTVVVLFTSELFYPGFIIFVYGPVARRIWGWCNILHSMLPFSPPS
jgi:hypothetical protein